MWQTAPGKRAVGARLALLPDPQPIWKQFAASTSLQIAGVVLLITVPMFFPQRLAPVMRYQVVHLELPRTAVPLPPEPPKIQPRVEPRPEPKKIEIEPPKVAKLMAPPVRPAPPKPRKIEPAPLPKLNPVFESAKLDVKPKQPARPREEVKTGMIANNTGSAAPATIKNKPLNKVQTGGFGDPDGVAGPGDPNKRANIARKGEFYLPGGPGYGNGTGGASGARGTVASAGFGSGIAIPPSGGGGGPRGAVQSGGFADQTTPASEAPKARPRETGPATQPVEILDKPNPVYSEEARRRRIEGEILVSVIFRAGGQVEVQGVRRGLGFGLDEAAVRAAQRIRFKPALRNGQPVDFPATVHIVFQLAY